MPFKRTPQTFTAHINAVTVGTGDAAVTIGGENVMPLFTFDAPIEHRPAIGVEVSDLGIDETLPKLAEYCRAKRLLPPVTDEWVRRLLRREGLSAQRIRTWKHSRDPDFDGKKNASGVSTGTARRAPR